MGNEFWFRPRDYGYGAAPTTWEGWMTVAVYLTVVVVATYFFKRQANGLPLAQWTAIMVVATVV